MAIAILAALAYWLLLWVSYTLVGGLYILGNFPRGLLQLTVWFTLVNAVGAIVAAVPLGIALRRWGSALGKSWVIAVGVATGIYFLGGWFIEHGPPPYFSGWVIDALQFVFIGIAPLLVVTTLKHSPKTGSRE